MQAAKQLLDRLSRVVAPRGRVLTAYSGGVDSTLVAAVTRRVLGRENAPAVIGDSASLPRHELEEARNIAAMLDLQLLEVHPDEQDDEKYQANQGDRCYFCKSHLYDTIHNLAAERGISFIANGTNIDDLSDHRPGLDAAQKAQVISPLLEAKLGKEQVRELAQHLSLPNWDKPAAACLASRIPFGTPVTLQRLTQVEQAETVLRDLGFTGFRVRHHEQIARIELPLDQVEKLMQQNVRTKITEQLKSLGYTYITFDLEGFRSGSGNVTLRIDTHSD